MTPVQKALLTAFLAFVSTLIVNSVEDKKESVDGDS
jgi:hypothetical protein